VSIKILKVRQHPVDELVARMRRVPLFGNAKVFPYKDATISLERIHTDFLAPAQHYVLQGNLERQRTLRLELARHGVDLFGLNGFVEMDVEGEEKPIGLLPPVVEESIEANGRIAHLICDGMHRVYLARLEWRIPQVVFVRGVPKETPYYAFPNIDGWDDVTVVSQLADDRGEKILKKWHRIENHKSLFRDFTGPFSNLSVARGKGQG
jgi:hypothetical protein